MAGKQKLAIIDKNIQKIHIKKTSTCMGPTNSAGTRMTEKSKHCQKSPKNNKPKNYQYGSK